MSNLKALLLLCLVAECHAALSARAPGFVDSKPRCNLYARFRLPGPTCDIASDEVIGFGFLTVTNESTLVYRPKLPYMCRMQMFTEKREPVPLRRLGKQMQTRFAELVSYSSKVIGRRGGGTAGGMLDCISVRSDSTTGNQLCSAEEVFVMKAPGRYRLLIELQVFVLRVNDPTRHKALVRLPPTEIWVYKDEPARRTVTELQQLADELGFPITVCHLPPGTSKWNKIEHRLLSFISRNWRGKPLTSHEVVVNLIAATTNRKGLKVRCELDPGKYPGGVKISDRQMARVHLERHAFHGDWNYTIHPVSGPEL